MPLFATGRQFEIASIILLNRMINLSWELLNRMINLSWEFLNGISLILIG